MVIIQEMPTCTGFMQYDSFIIAACSVILDFTAHVATCESWCIMIASSQFIQEMFWLGAIVMISYTLYTLVNKYFLEDLGIANRISIETSSSPYNIATSLRWCLLSHPNFLVHRPKCAAKLS